MHSLMVTTSYPGQINIEKNATEGERAIKGPWTPHGRSESAPVRSRKQPKLLDTPIAAEPAHLDPTSICLIAPRRVASAALGEAHWRVICKSARGIASIS